MIQKSLLENKEWFTKAFESVFPWDEKFVVEDKLVWVRCRRIPLKF